MKKTAAILLLIATTIACNKKNDLPQQNNTQNTKEMENTKTEKTALIIIDIQNDYFPGGTMELVDAEKAALKAKELLSYFRANKMPVIHIQHIALQEGATFFLPDTKGAEINKIVSPLADEKVITKNYPNSFRDTKLLEYLQENKITNLVFAGMMTDVCIDATVRASMDNGFKNILISDAVATRDRELNGETVSAKQINTAYLAGLNALDGLYAKVESSNEFLLAKK
ncbi:cysteine hydrolase family protein [Flavobacterium sp. NPDC079362]|uniref:cysteine hydrolase family protein n=1 Tax=Flavobacterium sp. NPDC079362 TaxID=3390566 RepID=UPI003D0126F1